MKELTRTPRTWDDFNIVRHGVKLGELSVIGASSNTMTNQIDSLRKFKVGDKVKCIEAYHRPRLTEGKIYTVVTYIDNGNEFTHAIELDGVMYHYRVTRFVLVSSKPFSKSDWL